MKSSNCKGLTLVELLVAVVILGVLGIMSYRAVEHAATQRDRLSADYAEWQSLARALSVMEDNLQQIVERQPSLTPNPPISLTVQADGTSRLRFERNDLQSGSRVVGLEFRNSQLSYLRWLNGDVQATPTMDVLLNDVSKITWQVFDGANWIPAISYFAAQQPTRPSGIRVEIELAKHGKISRVFPLR